MKIEVLINGLMMNRQMDRHPFVEQIAGPTDTWRASRENNTVQLICATYTLPLTCATYNSSIIIFEFGSCPYTLLRYVFKRAPFTSSLI